LEEKLELFLKEHLEKVVSLSRKAHLAYFDASISGKPEDYQKASELEIALSKVYSNKKDFEKIKSFKNSKNITDQFLKRQVDILYNSFLSYQMDDKLIEEIIKLSTKVEEEFATFRAKLDGKSITDNEIDELLKNSTNNDELEIVWKASKTIGQKVAEDVIKLVELRNEGAVELGYNNYFEMSLALNEQDVNDLMDLFNKLDKLTSDEFLKLKDEMDEILQARYDVDKNQLMPWHYQDKFFQLGPKIYDVDLDKFYKDKDLVKITKNYYNDINLNIDDLIEKSDLFEKEGKYQHAFCTDIDREGDVRVVCNIKPNYKWMGTMLHEFGHAVYDKYINRKLPWLLRTHAHILTTEAIAMLFGRFASNASWIKDVVGISEEERKEIEKDSYNSLKAEQLIFSRWVQVVFRFEKEMYSNPKQDLNQLWWNLVEKYQGLRKPSGRYEPDWASKIHISLYPAYYHNYILGELLASQLYFYIKDKVLMQNDDYLVSFSGQKDTGEYLKNLYFGYGALYPWNELIEKSTGEKLTPKYYAKQFVEN